MDNDYTLHLTDLGREIAENLYEHYEHFAKHLTCADVDADTAEV